MKKLILLFFITVLTISCKKEIHSTQGSIDIVSSMYFNASKGLEDMKQIHISRLNYYNGNMVEFVPNIHLPEMIDSVYYIKDSVFYNAGLFEDVNSLIFRQHEFYDTPRSIYNKKTGAIWVKIPIYDYDKREDMTDTILYGKREFKRFHIDTKENYSIYYFAKTDTILPYSFNRMAEKDYKGRLERIDSYDKKRDLFSTIVLIPKKTVENEAIKIFQYNEHLEKEFQKAKSEEQQKKEQSNNTKRKNLGWAIMA